MAVLLGTIDTHDQRLVDVVAEAMFRSQAAIMILTWQGTRPASPAWTNLKTMCWQGLTMGD
jgi:hypothetical protein